MRSLIKDIDLDTMYSMRRDGMSNAEIANALGVCRQTVIAYIGNQPKELRKQRCADRSGARTSKPKAADIPACLSVDRRLIALSGLFGKYELDIREGSIDICNDLNQRLRVNKELLGDFINELTAIKRKLEVLALENEAW